MTPESFDSFSYLLKSSVQKVENRQMPTCTYVVAKKTAIAFKISASLFRPWSNAGVSMRTTGPSVHEAMVLLTRRFEPLARLISWKQPGEFLIIVTGHTLLTEVFPLPVMPMTLCQRLG